MIAILDILPVLTVFPYALIYYAILVASTVLAFLSFRRSRSQTNQVLHTALMLAFFSQLVLVTLSLLSYQGYLALTYLFPLVFRVLSLVNIIWLVYALVSTPHRAIKPLIPWLATGLVLLAGSLLSLIWLPQSETTLFNATWFDTAFTVISLLTIIGGAVVYLLGENENWLFGTLILVFAAFGYVLYLALPNAGNLPGLVMLSQILYYPLLIGLAWQRSSAPQPFTDRAEVSTLGQQTAFTVQMASSFLDVSLQKEQEQICNALTHSLSLYLMADLCGIVKEPEFGGVLEISNLFDLIREEHLPPLKLEPQSDVLLFNQFQSQIPLISNDLKEFAFEKKRLMNLLGYNQIGNLFFFPFSSADNLDHYALICLSPYTSRKWTAEDLSHVAVLSAKVVQILENSGSIEQESHKLNQLRLSLKQLERERDLLAEQSEQNKTNLSELQLDYQQSMEVYETEIEQWVERQQTLEAQLEALKGALQENVAVASQANALKEQKAELERSLKVNQESAANLKSELRKAQEIVEALLPRLADQNPQQTQPGKLEFGPPHPGGFFQDLQKQIQITAEEFGGLKVSTQIETAGLPEISGNLQGLISELVRELEVNALKVSARQSEISIKIIPGQSESGNNLLEIHVTDNGQGLSQAEQQQFQQLLDLPEPRLSGQVGSPQALQQAIQLVRIAGGHWWIHSETGKQTTYRVSLPLGQSE